MLHSRLLQEQFKNNWYWAGRRLQRQAEYDRKSDIVLHKIITAHNRARKAISADIERMINKAAIAGNAPDYLSLKDTQDALFRLERVLSGIRSPEIRRQVEKQLNISGYRYRITRLQAMKDSVTAQVGQLCDMEQRLTTSHLEDTFTSQYYHNLFDLQKRTGIGKPVAALSDARVAEVLKNKWSGANYSQRIWRNAKHLGSTIEEVITSGLMAGKGTREMAVALQERFDVSKHQAVRLIRTETAYISSQADKTGYADMELEKYRFLAVLDLKTSSICRKLDQKEFLVKAGKPGKNMPPMHPNCRSITVAVYDDDDKYFADDTRAARDPITGEHMTVPANMSYDEWYKKYVTVEEDARYNEDMKNVIRESLRKGIVKDEVNIQKQQRHLEKFVKDSGRSYVFGDEKHAEYLYNKLKGTGVAVLDINGDWLNLERVSSDKIEGVYKSADDAVQLETKNLMIVYSKTGSHIYPRKGD